MPVAETDVRMSQLIGKETVIRSLFVIEPAIYLLSTVAARPGSVLSWLPFSHPENAERKHEGDRGLRRGGEARSAGGW